jgi:hypothetical protein
VRTGTFVGGILQENPFFIPPERFIHELKACEAAGTAPPA